MPISHALLIMTFEVLKGHSLNLLYAQETTTAQLRSHSCFPDHLVQMEIEYFQTIRKRDFAEILQNFLTAGHLLFSRPFPAAGHIATANKFR